MLKARYYISKTLLTSSTWRIEALQALMFVVPSWVNLKYNSDSTCNNKMKCWMRQILLIALLLFCVVEGIYICVSRVTVLECMSTNFCIFSRNLTHLYNGFLICDIHKCVFFLTYLNLVALDN
jgi:hypothetical protein